MEHLGTTISDRRLIATLDTVVENATAFWQIGLTRHPDFTLHGIVHSRKISEVLQGITENMPADCSLNDNEKFILVSSAYLHDIGRCFQDESQGSVCHAEKGAQMAWPIIKDFPLTENQKENIIHCIKSHRFRGKHTPKTIEAKVLLFHLNL